MPITAPTRSTQETAPALRPLRMLSVSFTQEIAPDEIECFRGAIAEKAGLQHERYHNHNNAPDAPSGFHYRYSLIQYQLHRHRPRILFLDDAIEDAQHFFTQSDWNLTLNDRAYQTAIADLKATQCTVGSTPGQFHSYRLFRWMALNEENFAKYTATAPLRDKIALLERILSGHLLAFFTGIGMVLPQRFQLDITHLNRVHAGSYRGIKAQLFDIEFRADLLLPYGIGVGKGVGLGYGRLGGGEREKEQEFRRTENVDQK
jgi:hypothetical protein